MLWRLALLAGLAVAVAAGGPAAAGAGHRVFLPLVAQRWDQQSPAAVWRWQNPRPLGSDLTAVAYASAEIGWAVGTNGSIVKTVDGGRSWTVQAAGRGASLLG